MPSIILSTVNARYIHASLGLRYLFANLGTLATDALIKEFTLEQRAEDIAEALLALEPKIIGLGVYIWNVELTTKVVRLLKVIAPEIHIIVGGPEVSYETSQQEICKLANTVVTGAADLTFAEVCQSVLSEEPLPSNIVSSLPVPLEALQSPYCHYSEEDIAHRVLYVEASRGCPFKCEFCLSSLDKTAKAFDLNGFLDDMQQLIDRGAQHFKFVDRTFNLKAETSRQILEFFLNQISKPLFLHFELIPDRLPAILMELLPQFPKNSLQFEIGIQSFNPDVQHRISRKQNHIKTCENLRWLRSHTHAHIHADLIFGLPGETLESFGEGFNLLHSLDPQEIQVGILKRLRGTPIERHTQAYDMRYMTEPPYRILAHKDASFNTVQRMVRFARYWDLVGNSGRFPNLLPILLVNNAFNHFMTFSDWLFQTTHQTHKISLQRQFQLLYQHLCDRSDCVVEELNSSLISDYKHNHLKGKPTYLLNRAELPDPLPGCMPRKPLKRHLEKSTLAGHSRQSRHL